MTTPIILPQLIVEAGLVTASPVQPAGTFTLNDAVNGVLGTSMLGGGIAWTDISPQVISFTVTRPSTRLQGPLFNFQAGTASILLDNSDGRFDPDNLAGPYVTPGVPAMRFGAYLDQAAYGTAGWTATATAFTAITGVPLNAARWYANTSYSFTGSLVALAAAGTRICLELTPTVAGSPADRAAIAAMLDAMLASGADVRVSLWHEPNLNGLSASDFTSMIAYYGPTVRARYPLYVVFSGSDCIEANGYFPGAANCDGVAADCYGLSTANLDNCADMADNHGLPLGLWEFSTAFDLGISPSPIVGATQAQDVAFLAYVQALFTARIAAGKPVGDILLFTGGSSPASGGGTGSGNFLGTSLSDAGGFEAGIAHWAAVSGCTIARSTAWSHSGTASLAMTSTGAGTMVAGCENLGTSTAFAMPVAVGQSAAATCWFRAATVARSCAAGIGWYTSGGAHIGSDTVGATVTNATTGTGVFASVTGTAPATAAFAIIKPQVQSPGGAGEVHYVDDPQISALPASIDHTAPIQYGWDWRIAPLAAMQAALDNRGAIPAVTSLTAMVPVRIRASFLAVAYPLYSGFADGWLPGTVTYEGGYAEISLPATDGQKVLNGITLPATGAVGAGEAAGARVSRVLDAAGWYTGSLYRQVAAGAAAVQAYAGGDTAWNLLQIATDSEIGQLYVDGSGRLTFRGRQGLLSDARSNTPQAVFGDLPGTVQAAGTELPYAAVGRASDDTTIANDIQATRTGGTLQHVQDAASIAKYKFPRSYARSDLILADDATTLQWAQWVLYVSKSGEDRFESLQVDPQADPVNLWPQVLGREVGDRIQVWQRPASVAPVTKDCFVAGITHTWDSVTSAWLTTWTLQDASKYGSFLTLDNPILGRLNDNALAF